MQCKIIILLFCAVKVHNKIIYFLLNLFNNERILLYFCEIFRELINFWYSEEVCFGYNQLVDSQNILILNISHFYVVIYWVHSIDVSLVVVKMEV